MIMIKGQIEFFTFSKVVLSTDHKETHQNKNNKFYSSQVWCEGCLKLMDFKQPCFALRASLVFPGNNTLRKRNQTDILIRSKKKKNKVRKGITNQKIDNKKH
uniref:Uncharacterized protein n=1 Tax=Cacopsylla melanoneura TaxID=428564 RepID=A0A8D9E5R9_9HEMI